MVIIGKLLLDSLIFLEDKLILTLENCLLFLFFFLTDLPYNLKMNSYV